MRYSGSSAEKMRLFAAAGLIAVVMLLGSCGAPEGEDPAIGEAYAGPATLNLHKDIDPKSATTALAHHGDKLDILGQRRRWYRVRTPKGGVGWTDDRQLLDTNQMERLRGLAKETAGLPSQGSATTFDSLNVHTEPNRLSPSFVQVAKGEKFEVVAHKVTARNGTIPRRQLIPPKPKPEKAAKKPKEKSSLPPPPEPAAPGLPQDWVALSKERAMVPEEDLPPVAQDDWTLVRTASGQSGWVLTSRVYMLIPDEVAQYAEGHRITSYFSIGKVNDNGEAKDIWLWTTSVGLGEDHDFDGYRVFTWSVRRHRYETAYIQRREEGFFPVLAKPNGEFSVCLAQPDDTRVRKSYRLIDTRVKAEGQKPCEPTIEDKEQTPEEEVHIVTHPVEAAAGLTDRMKAKVKGWFGK
jgi:uncharacterized protein YgiM (DUF1202 family)